MAYHAIKSMTTAALMLAASATAFAGSSQFSLVGGGLVPGIDVSLTIKDSDFEGYDYDFVVSNNAGPGIITGVYFEELWSSKIWGNGMSTGDAVLEPGSANPVIDGWQDSKVSHTIGMTPVYVRYGRGALLTYQPAIDDGIHVGTNQIFSFSTNVEKVSLDDITDVVGDDGFNIAIRLHNDSETPDWGLADQINDGPELLLLASFIQTERPNEQDPENEQRVVTGTPSPTAAVAGLALLGVLGLRRRR